MDLEQGTILEEVEVGTRETCNIGTPGRSSENEEINEKEKSMKSI